MLTSGIPGMKCSVKCNAHTEKHPKQLQNKADFMDGSFTMRNMQPKPCSVQAVGVGHQPPAYYEATPFQQCLSRSEHHVPTLF